MVSLVCLRVLRYVFLRASIAPEVSWVSSRVPTSIKKPLMIIIFNNNLLPMWTAPGKTWLSVNTVKPLESVVTLYSGAWSTASSGLWPYNHELVNSGESLQTIAYLKGDGWVVLSDWVCSGVCVNSVEDTRQHSWVRSKFSSLDRALFNRMCRVLRLPRGNSCFVT